MGDFRYCEGIRSEVPFFHESMALHIYTMEELCFYLETNLFLLDTGVISDSLFRWIGTELKQGELSEQLREIFRTQKDIFSCVAFLFEQSGLYSKEELEHLKTLILRMQGKTPMERHKLKGDRFVEEQKYRQAVYTYLELLQPEYTTRMTEELQGDIWHNLGVAYARLFLFEEAASCFANAYKCRKNQESQNAYLFAMNYVPDSFPMEEQDLNLNFSIMRDALNRFTEISEDQSLYQERRKALEAGSNFDWKSRQRKLISEWKNSYDRMTI